MTIGNRRLFGEDPLQVRASGHYKLGYIQSFVEKWYELIDWEQRAESEGDMHEVGVQEIQTYGDFQGTCEDEEPDFFVHAAEKLYIENGQGEERR